MVCIKRYCYVLAMAYRWLGEASMSAAATTCTTATSLRRRTTAAVALSSDTASAVDTAVPVAMDRLAPGTATAMSQRQCLYTHFCKQVSDSLVTRKGGNRRGVAT